MGECDARGILVGMLALDGKLDHYEQTMLVGTPVTQQHTADLVVRGSLGVAVDEAMSVIRKHHARAHRERLNTIRERGW